MKLTVISLSLILFSGLNAMDQKDYDKQLLRAADAGELEVVQNALDNKAQLETRGVNNCTPLHYAACKGHTEIIKLLIRSGANIEATNDVGSTPLAHVTCADSLSGAECLLESKAAVNSTMPIGISPLAWAQFNHDAALVELLLKFGSLVNFPRVEELLSIPFGESRIFTSLLNLTDQHKLITDILEDQKEITLIGQDHNQCDAFGNTPLIWAAARGKHEIIKALLEYDKADVSLANKKGQTALIAAQKHNNTSAIELINNYFNQRKKAIAQSTTIADDLIDLISSYLGASDKKNISIKSVVLYR